MKSRSILILIIAVLILSGCGKSEPTVSTELSGSTNTESEETIVISDSELEETLKNTTFDSIIEKTSLSGSEDTSSSGSTESILPEVEGSDTMIIEPKESEADIKREESEKILTFSESGECESLQYLVQECKDSFVLKLAEKTGQIKFCSKIQDSLQKQVCENNISFMKQDCYSIIGDSELKTSCLDKQKKEKEIQTGEQQKEKIITTAKNSNNYDGCSMLESFTKITQCIEPIAIKEQDIFICNEVFTDNSEKLDCIESIAYNYDRAIIRKAFSNKDLSICENIYNYEVKEQCKQMQFN